MTAKENLLEAAQSLLPSKLVGSSAGTTEESDLRFFESSETLLLSLALDPNSPYYLTRLVVSEALNGLQVLISAADSLVTTLNTSTEELDPPVIDRNFELSVDALQRISGRVAVGAAPEADDIDDFVLNQRRFAASQLVPQENFLSQEGYRQQLLTSISTINGVLDSTRLRLARLRPGTFFVDNLDSVLSSAKQLSVYVDRIQNTLDDQEITLSGENPAEKAGSSSRLLAESSVAITLIRLLNNLSVVSTRQRTAGTGIPISETGGEIFGRPTAAIVIGSVVQAADNGDDALLGLSTGNNELVFEVDTDLDGGTTEFTVSLPISTSPDPIVILGSSWVTEAGFSITVFVDVVRDGVSETYSASVVPVPTFASFSDFPAAAGGDTYAFDLFSGGYFKDVSGPSWNIQGTAVIGPNAGAGAFIAPTDTDPAFFDDATNTPFSAANVGDVLEVTSGTQTGFYPITGYISTTRVQIGGFPTAEAALDYTVYPSEPPAISATEYKNLLDAEITQGPNGSTGPALNQLVTITDAGPGTSLNFQLAASGLRDEGADTSITVITSGTDYTSPLGIGPLITSDASGGQFLNGDEFQHDPGGDFSLVEVGNLLAISGSGSGNDGFHRIIEVVSSTKVRLAGTFTNESGLQYEVVTSPSQNSRIEIGSSPSISDVVDAINTSSAGDRVLAELRPGREIALISLLSGVSRGAETVGSSIQVTSQPLDGTTAILGFPEDISYGSVTAIYSDNSRFQGTGVRPGMVVEFSSDVVEGGTDQSLVVSVRDNNIVLLEDRIPSNPTIVGFAVFSVGALSYRDVVEGSSQSYSNAFDTLIEDTVFLEELLGKSVFNVGDRRRSISFVQDKVKQPAEELRDILLGYTSPRSTTLVSVFNTLRERGFDQTLDLLKLGDVFSALQEINSSYSSGLRRSLRSIGIDQ